MAHFKKIGFEPRKLVDSMFTNFFSEYVQYQLLSKIFMLFLSEGTKILFRMCYSIMKKLHESILSIGDPALMIETLKKQAPNIINDSEYVISWGFKMKLTRYNNSYIFQKATEADAIVKVRIFS